MPFAQIFSVTFKHHIRKGRMSLPRRQRANPVFP
ncbi:hypothetical protein PSAB6_10332 [Paraburkholderia sabiae]|nr:hypothetical protein PSAB6_10332 [Paraburkholderia sabiae]